MKNQQPDRDVERVRALLARGRRRRAVGALTLAAVAAAVIVVPPVFLEMSPTSKEDDQDRSSSAGPPRDSPESTPPRLAEERAFTTDPCPDPPEPVDRAGNGLDVGRGDLVSVRLCRLSVDRAAGSGPRPGFGRPPADALLIDLDGFVSEVGGLPEADPRRCAAVEPVADPQGLYLTYDDGRVDVIGSSFTDCRDLTVDGRRVEMAAVFEVFAERLATQRRQVGSVPAPTSSP